MAMNEPARITWKMADLSREEVSLNQELNSLNPLIRVRDVFRRERPLNFSSLAFQRRDTENVPSCLRPFREMWVSSDEQAHRAREMLLAPRFQELVQHDTIELHGRYGLGVMGRTGESPEECAPVEYCAPVDLGVQPDLGTGPSRSWVKGQVYLEDSKAHGLDARLAWTKGGGKGKGVSVLDIEFGWNLPHEDLPCLRIPGSNLGHKDHGTAVLGILCARHDDKGVSGFAPEASPFLAAVAENGLPDQVDNSIHLFAAQADPGSVILVEVQDRRSNGPLLPVEAFEPAKAAIEWAVRERGVHVIEAAGNNGYCLDNERTIGDTGAVVVGAGCPLKGTRTLNSNCGQRVDMHGWGLQVVTTGFEGDLQSKRPLSQHYSQSFNSTSAAAAMVAGAFACLSGIARLHRRKVDPVTLRERVKILGSHREGILNGIGSRPDLRAVIEDFEKGGW